MTVSRILPYCALCNPSVILLTWSSMTWFHWICNQQSNKTIFHVEENLWDRAPLQLQYRSQRWRWMQSYSSVASPKRDFQTVAQGSMAWEMCTQSLKSWNLIQPHENLWYQEPKGRHKAKFESPTKPPLDCSHKLLRVHRWSSKEVKSLEIFPTGWRWSRAASCWWVGVSWVPTDEDSGKHLSVYSLSITQELFSIK